uniref:Lipoprotein n=2 Tax=unclassified Prevotella TaxID=2638335 RepID=A0AB33JDI1_9BACT
MKHIALLLLITLLAACGQNDTADMPDIQIGKGESLNEISINKETVRDIILSGGDGKFSVNVADSKIATATMIEDTLRIKGVFEGQTFATILSHDLRKRIEIKVIPPRLSLSQETLRIYPKDLVKYVTVTGGGDVVDMKVNDPDSVIDAKWNAKTNVVEIKAHYEGNATITFKGKEDAERKLNVVVKAENEVTTAGIYSTRSRTIYTIIKNVMVAKKTGTGVWFYNNARPYGRLHIPLFDKDMVLQIAPIINPVKGKRMTIKVLASQDVRQFNFNQEYPVVVEDVKGRLAVLRGHGFKLLTPYEKRP